MLRTCALILAILSAATARAEFWKGRDNAPLAFSIVDATDGSPLTGATPTVRLLPDGGTQATATNSAVEEGNGQYSIDLTASEWDADVIGVQVTATGGYTPPFTVVTTAPPDLALYVSEAAGDDANSGLTPNAPKATIGSAITAAAAGDYTIYIAAGDYTMSGSTSIPAGTIFQGADDKLVRIAGNPGSGAAGLFNLAGNAEFHDVAITATSQGNCIQTAIGGAAARVVVEDCYTFGDDDCFAFYAPASGSHTTILRRNTINCSSWDGISYVATNAHAVIEDNVFSGSHFAIYSLMTTQVLTIDVAGNKANFTTTTGDQAFIKIVQTSTAKARINAVNNLVTCYSAQATPLYLDDGSGGGSIVFNDAGGNAIDWSTSTYDAAMRVDVYPARTNALVEAGQVGTDAGTASTQATAAAADAAAIEAITSAIGATGNGLTAVPYNSAWDAEIESEATDALVGYQATLTAAIEASQIGVDTAAILTDTGTTLPAAIASGAGSLARDLTPPASAFTFKVSRRSDGTVGTDRTLRLIPGSTEDIRIGLDMSRLYGKEPVYSVGTPAVSGGSLTADDEGRYDTMATMTVGGTATAGESRTISVSVTMQSGDVVVVRQAVEVAAE